jgi:kelch-like protein 2/3
LGDTTLTNILSRREEVVLHRARIGHTHLTHVHLLKNEDQPECIPCGEPLTVEHILLHCLDFAAARQKYYCINSLNDLFNTVEPTRITGFLKEIQLFTKF